MKKMINKRIITIVTVLIFSLPFTVSASTMYFVSDTATTSVGDTIIIHANLDTQGKSVNAIEGLIVLNGIENATLRDLSIAGSSFTLWPEKPSFVLRNNSIYFSGGIPGGVNGSSIHVFDIVLEVTNTNKISISGNTVTAYVDDGKGTPVKVPVETASLSSMRKVGYIPLNEYESIKSLDKTEPASFEIEFGKDEYAYEGKIFISFSTQDRESGIDHFEIKEGDRQFVRAGSPYVLQDQDPTEYISVRAIDKAGNVREVSVNEFPILWITLLLVLLAMLVIISIFMSTFKRK